MNSKKSEAIILNVQSLERALTILNKLSEYPDGIQITRLAEEVGLTKSTTHRLLATLVNMNYVSKSNETDKYKLGLQVLFLSKDLLNNSNIVSAAKPLLEQLSRELNENVHLCIEDSYKVVYIDKIESNQPIKMASRIGSRASMYSTAVGKVLLSGMDQKQLNNAISKMNFIQKTAATITTPEALYQEIEQVKQQGFALDNLENEEFMRCIAFPIYNYEGKIIASFSISGLSERMTDKYLFENLAITMKKCSIEISRSLGYSGKQLV